MSRLVYVFPAVLLLALLGTSIPVQAEDAPVADDQVKQMEAALLGMVEFVGKTRLTDEGAKLLIQHAPSFEAIGEDAAFEKLMEDSFDETGKYDYGAILQFKPYVAWVARSGVDAEAWLRTRFRYLLVTTRVEMIEDRALGLKDLDEQLAQIEEMRSTLGEEAYQQMLATLTQARAMFEAFDRLAKAIPVADEAEKKVLKTHGKALRKAVGEDEEEEVPYDDMGDE